jgi:uncharacterized protein (DUF488 family)
VRLLSVGHSNKSFEEFVHLCRGADVRIVADIRRFPRSRRYPHFAREHFQRALPGHGIDYVWLGEELGGFREGSYEDWMSGERFGKGIAELERLAENGTVAFMCAEGDPSSCHRRFVARALAQRGHEVSHLLPDGRLKQEEPPLSLLDP